MFSEQFRERLYTSKWEDKNIEFCKFHVVLDHQLRMDKRTVPRAYLHEQVGGQEHSVPKMFVTVITIKIDYSGSESCLFIEQSEVPGERLYEQSEQFRGRLYTSRWEDKNIEFCKFHVVLDHQLRMESVSPEFFTLFRLWEEFSRQGVLSVDECTQYDENVKKFIPRQKKKKEAAESLYYLVPLCDYVRCVEVVRATIYTSSETNSI
ncbi:hypothetical protein J6590_094590 [Homalodisca vitripennis]|nr:hypothetical protein J6590_094590 [Homalodisca vitripennis]